MMEGAQGKRGTNRVPGLDDDRNSLSLRDRLTLFGSQLRYDLRSIVGNYPRLFLPVMRRMRKYKSKFVNVRTELVIEGFPRSGNTFAHFAFHYAQRRLVQTAHHVHVPAQVIEAARLKVPVLVIVRRPKDAVVALKLMNPRLGLTQVLKSYVRYHQAILPHIDGCIVATFDQVTSDLGTVIARINRRYGTDFEPFVHTKNNVDDVLSNLTRIAYEKIPGRSSIGTIPDRPKQREEQREILKDRFDRLRSRREFQLAQQLYDRFAAHAAS